MEFSNAAIDLTALPKAEDVRLQPIEPSYWKVLQLEWLITVTILAVTEGAAIFFIRPLQQPWIIALMGGGWLLIAIVYYTLIYQSFKRRAYALRERDVLSRTGWIVRELEVCPFNRIQHCSVHAGPLERKFGLASISLYTAGSEGADFRIPGLKEETASSIREFIMQKIKTDEPAAH
ncbi:MAG TPA: PH domain-containing protein [Chitinophagaceae bacterium]|nr:PH domain-containing protein [Chitinophagaceae bacterium]